MNLQKERTLLTSFSFFFVPGFFFVGFVSLFNIYTRYTEMVLSVSILSLISLYTYLSIQENIGIFSKNRYTFGKTYIYVFLLNLLLIYFLSLILISLKLHLFFTIILGFIILFFISVMPPAISVAIFLLNNEELSKLKRKSRERKERKRKEIEEIELKSKRIKEKKLELEKIRNEEKLALEKIRNDRKKKFKKEKEQKNKVWKEKKRKRINAEKNHFKEMRIRLSKRYVENVNFLKNSIILFDSNIYMENSAKCNQIFNLIRTNKINTLELTSQQLDEIANNRKSSNKEKQKAARWAYRIIGDLEEKDLLKTINIQQEAKKGAYADPEIMQYLRKMAKDGKMIIFVTEDIDLKIRTNQLVKKDKNKAYLEVFNIENFFNKYVSYFDESFHLEYERSVDKWLEVAYDKRYKIPLELEFKRELINEFIPLQSI